MPYATQQDLIDRFGQQQLLAIADRDGDGVLDTAAVDGALADAEGEIDSYVARRYDLPLASVPARLTSVAADIAFYRLHPAAQPEDVRQRYLDAIRFLNDVAKGLAVIDAGGDEPDPAPGGVSHTAPERIFTRETLKDF